MEAITLVTLMALVVKIVGVIKNIGKDNNAVITQALTWAVGVALLALASKAELTQTMTIFGNVTLGEMDGPSIILVGLSYASGGSFAYDFKKAFDGTDSAAEPKLLGGLAPPEG